MKSIIANLGFVFQTSGVITLLAVIPGFIYNEQTPLISLFVTSTVFLVAGFAMNALSQRKGLDFKASCILISIVFLFLGIIGSIPYLYCNVFSSSDIISKIINSIFESISGFTTTGASMIVSPASLPKSLIFYRSLTQWIGGVGIVFIILVFLNSKGTLDKLGKAIGFTRLTSNIQNSYIRIFGIYAVYTIIFFSILYVFGLRDWLNNICLVFGGISAGGFSPVNDLSTLIAFPNNLILGILMLIGGTSFVVHYRIFTGNFKKAADLEFVVFILIIAVFSIVFWLVTKANLVDSFFHVASASSTTGYSYIDLSSLAVNVKMLLFVLMFIGGMTSSTAGGVKIMNVLIFFKSLPWVIKGVITGNLDGLTLGGKELKHLNIYSALIVIILSLAIIVGFAFVFTSYGYSLENSVFALTSAFSNTGLYIGVANPALPIVLKLILMLLMIVGRIGLITLFVALMPRFKQGKLEDVPMPTKTIDYNKVSTSDQPNN